MMMLVCLFSASLWLLLAKETIQLEDGAGRGIRKKQQQQQSSKERAADVPTGRKQDRYLRHADDDASYGNFSSNWPADDNASSWGYDDDGNSTWTYDDPWWSDDPTTDDPWWSDDTTTGSDDLIGGLGGGLFGGLIPNIGAFDGMSGIFEQWIGSIVFGNLGCPISGEHINEPACAFNLGGDEGVWVCRTLINPFNGERSSFSMCTETNHTIETADKCGCCGGACPTSCNCPCTAIDGSKGVRVLLSTDFMGQTYEMEECLDPKVAVSIVRNGTMLSCVTNCSEPAQNPFPLRS